MNTFYTQASPVSFGALHAECIKLETLAEMRAYIRATCATAKNAIRAELKRARKTEKRARLEWYLILTEKDEARALNHFSSDLR